MSGDGERIPPAVYDCLRCLPDPASRWQLGSELGSGRRNRSWLASRGPEKVVIRVGAGSDHQLGVDRYFEMTVQRLAAAAGIAPDLLYADPRSGVQVSRYLAGEHCEAGNAEHVRLLFKQLKHLHGLPVKVDARDLLAHAEGYWRRLQRTAPATAEALLPYRRSMVSPSARFRAMPRLLALCHCDPIPENTLVVAGRLYLIDWEYAAGGDPYFDLAAVVEEYAVPESTVDGLLAAYDDTAKDAGERLYLLRLLYRYLAMLWYAQLLHDSERRKLLAKAGLEQQLRRLDSLLAPAPVEYR